MAAMSLDSAFLRQLVGLDPRQVFGLTMGRLADGDPDLTVVVSDYGRRLGLEGLRQSHPQAYVECGIAEQNQVEVAAALANEGFHTFSVSYAPFVTARVLDQVRIMMGLMASPVCVVGVSAGFGGGDLGMSHMALEDIACMRAIPNVELYTPADVVELARTLALLAVDPRPSYVRVALDDPARLARPADAPFGPRLGSILREGSDVCLVACGGVVFQALDAAELLGREGVSARVVEVPCVRPLDEHVVEACRGVRLVVSVEEHTRVGGLGGALAEALTDASVPRATDVPSRLLRLGSPDHPLAADLPSSLVRTAGLDAAGIARSVLETI